jgi:hypothetical protein
MAKTQIFRVVGGRIHFKCFACQSRRMVSIPPGVRRRSLRCHKCGETTHCNFNRREIHREQQKGKVFVTTSDGKSIEVDLHDMSLNGIGFDVSVRDIRKMIVGREIQFLCTWNSKLIRQGRYVVRSIKGRRIGAQRN